VPGAGSRAGGRFDRLALRVTEPVQGRFRLGRVIGLSFSIWRRNLGLLFALALVVSAPRILYAVYGMLTPRVTAPVTLPDDLAESFLSWAAPLLLRSTGIALVRSLFLLSPFWVAVPAAVVERSRSFLRRSWILTRGRRLQVFSILLILYAIDWGVGRLYGVVADGLPTLLRVAVWWTQDLLLVALAAVLAVVGYHALRLEKDGVDASDLVEVFG